MANNHQLPSATTVLKWLREGGGDTICGPPKYYDDIDSLSSISLTRRLYDSCAEQLSLFCRGVPALQDCSRKARKAAADVDTKFRLLGRCFEHGKLEACLDDEELLQCVLKYLVRIGTLLLSDGSGHVDKFSPSCDDTTKSSTRRLDELITLARSFLPCEDGEDQSSTESEALTDDDRHSPTAGSALRSANRSIHAIRDTVLMLMQLMPTLEATYKHKFSRRWRRNALEVTSVSPEALQYVSHVRDKFPNAHPEVINRLGEANWQRHERLRTVSSMDEATTVHEEPAVLPVTAKSVFRPQSLFYDSALGSSIRTASARAESVASHRSFASSADGAARNVLRVPQMPITNWGEPFNCPFCLASISCSSRIAWKRHVYHDLQAYTCTWAQCSEPFTVFTDRQSWARHELDHHLSVLTYHCSLCSKILHDEREFWSHSQEKHGISPSALRTVALAKCQRRQQPDFSLVVCQLCSKEGFASNQDYATHAGKHLEEVALIALPPTEEDDSEDDTSKDSISEFVPYDDARLVSGNGRAAAAHGDVAVVPEDRSSDDEVFAMFDEPQAPDESQINYAALSVDFAEFMPGRVSHDPKAFDELSQPDRPHFAKTVSTAQERVSIEAESTLENPTAVELPGPSQVQEHRPHLPGLEPFEPRSERLREAEPPLTDVYHRARRLSDPLHGQKPDKNGLHHYPGDTVASTRQSVYTRPMPHAPPTYDPLAFEFFPPSQPAPPPAPAAQSKKTQWSPAVRDYVSRSFAPENALKNVSRPEMEVKLKQMITEMANSGSLETINWATYPLPQHLIVQERNHASPTLFPDHS